jgi:hypothetical protein
MQIEYTAADVEKFWSQVDKNGPVIRPELGPCWVWTRAKATRYGYGIFGPAWKRVYRAHRFAWTMEHGPIPDGLFLCHACDNPPCVRPSHLFLGTQKDNMADCSQKGRIDTSAKHYGTAHHSARLTENDVREIRRRAGIGDQPRTLSNEYGVSFQTIWRIVRGKNWKHLL